MVIDKIDRPWSREAIHSFIIRSKRSMILNSNLHFPQVLDMPGKILTYLWLSIFISEFLLKSGSTFAYFNCSGNSDVSMTIL